MTKMVGYRPLKADRLRELFHYDANTGVFVRRSTNKVSGSLHCAGYLTIRIDYRAYLCHRLAWLYMRGHWPSDQIDHINRIRTDNRLINLRECSNAENCQNVSAHIDGSGVRGVSWDKSRNKWQVGIGINGRRVALGRFDSKEAARQAYIAAKKQTHYFGGADV